MLKIYQKVKLIAINGEFLSGFSVGDICEIKAIDILHERYLIKQVPPHSITGYAYFADVVPYTRKLKVGDTVITVVGHTSCLGDDIKKDTLAIIKEVDSSDETYLIEVIDSDIRACVQADWIIPATSEEANNLDDVIKVGSFVEVIEDMGNDSIKVGDIAEVIEVDSSDIPYYIKSGSNKSWTHAYKVKLYKEDSPFKTQKNIWDFLTSKEGAVVEHVTDSRKFTLKEGNIFSVTYNKFQDIPFYVPTVWRLSREIYIEKKEWWEVNGNKPTICWYGDSLENDGKPKFLGLVRRVIGKSYDGFETIDRNGNILIHSWKYAVPVTEQELKDYFFQENLV
jgi:hypothetical protein